MTKNDDYVYNIMSMSKKFCGLILKTAYDKLGSTSDISVLGKSMLDWVKLSFGDAPVGVVDEDKSIDLPLLCRPFALEGYDYIVVLYSDTPLITRKTVQSAVEEAYNSGRNVLKMTRGYVFSCAFVHNSDKIYTNDTFYFDEEDFITAFSFKQVGLITDILKNRILDYHMEQGVYFEDLAGTVIGCDVTIDPRVVVGHNNVILGRTRVREGARLGCGNNLTDCVIEKGAFVEYTHAVRSYVGKNCKVGPFVRLCEDNIIGEGSEIGSFIELKDKKIPAGSVVKRITRE